MQVPPEVCLQASPQFLSREGHKPAARFPLSHSPGFFSVFLHWGKEKEGEEGKGTQTCQSQLKLITTCIQSDTGLFPLLANIGSSQLQWQQSVPWSGIAGVWAGLHIQRYGHEVKKKI